MGGKSSTSTTTNEPPKWAQGLFESSAKDAQKLYNSKKGFNVYQGDRVANMGDFQTDALRSMGGAGDRARGMDYNAADFGNLAQKFGNDTYSEQELGSVAGGNLANLARDMNYNTDQYGGLASRARGDTFAEQNLQGIAAGNSLMGDPLFQEMLDAQSAKIADQANFAASSAGRYGSGMHTGVLAQNVGDFRRQAVLDNYAQERQRQLQANQMLDAGRFQRLGMEGDFRGREDAARQQRFSNIGQGQQMMMAAAGQMDANRFNRLSGQADMFGQQNAANQQRLSNILQGDQTALSAGTMLQQQRQAELDAQMQRWKEADMQDWTRLGALQAAAQGAAGPYGMTTQTQNQPFNPLGILGSVMGMFTASDRRLKTNVIRYGSDPRGFGLYEFEYKATPDVRWRGVMADEVEQVDPAAVIDLGSYKAVNYDRLGLKMERV